MCNGNHDHTLKCFFPCFHGELTCYVEKNMSLCVLQRHKGYRSLHTFALQSHCSSINLHHSAIWSSSSHSHTHTYKPHLAGIDFTRTRSVYKAERMKSLWFSSLYKHGFICVPTLSVGGSAPARMGHPAVRRLGNGKFCKAQHRISMLQLDSVS